MRSRILRIVVYDREREWLVPKTTFISWVNGQLVIQSATSKTRAEIQEFLREHNIRVVELVDSKEQDKRLREQSELKAKGDEEAMSKDNEYIKAMEYGMPPISGWGLGIDRFLQFLTNSYNIRDVVLYPLLKKRENVEDDEE